MGQTIRKIRCQVCSLTTKHHDGYALWPSMEASRDYGRPWNSMEIGPKRDLVGEYTTALRKQTLRWDSTFHAENGKSVILPGVT